MNHIFHSNSYNIILQAHAFALASPFISQLQLEGIYFKGFIWRMASNLKKNIFSTIWNDLYQQATIVFSIQIEDEERNPQYSVL